MILSFLMWAIGQRVAKEDEVRVWITALFSVMGFCEFLSYMILIKLLVFKQ